MYGVIHWYAYYYMEGDKMEFHFRCMDCARFNRSCTDMIGIEPAGSCFVKPECKVCEYYLGLNEEGGICTYHYRTKKEEPDAAAGHDDLVNAKDSCRNFRDRYMKCLYCAHYQKGKVYGIGYCSILPPAGTVQKRKRVSIGDICENYELNGHFYNPFSFEKER